MYGFRGQAGRFFERVLISERSAKVEMEFAVYCKFISFTSNNHYIKLFIRENHTFGNGCNPHDIVISE